MSPELAQITGGLIGIGLGVLFFVVVLPFLERYR